MKNKPFLPSAPLSARIGSSFGGNGGFVRTVQVLLIATILLLLPQTGHAKTARWYYRFAIQIGGFAITDPSIVPDERPVGLLLGPFEHTFLWEVAGQHNHLLGVSSGVHASPMHLATGGGQEISMYLGVAYWYQIKGSEPGDGPYFRANLNLTYTTISCKSDAKEKEEAKAKSLMWIPHHIIGPSLKLGWGWGWPLHWTVRYFLGISYELGIGVFKDNALNAVYLDTGFLF